MSSLSLKEIPYNYTPKKGTKVIHVGTLEIGEVVGESLSHTKLKINFPDCGCWYPAPKRNIREIVQS